MRRTAVLLALGLLVVGACSSSSSAPTAALRHPPSTKASQQATPTIAAALPAIEAFVEKERGLKFKRPVKAEVLGRSVCREARQG